MMIDDERFTLLQNEAAAIAKCARERAAVLDAEWAAICRMQDDELKLRQGIANIAQSVIGGVMTAQEAGERLEEFIKEVSGHGRTL